MHRNGSFQNLIEKLSCSCSGSSRKKKVQHQSILSASLVSIYLCFVIEIKFCLLLLKVFGVGVFVCLYNTKKGSMHSSGHDIEYPF